MKKKLLLFTALLTLLSATATFAQTVSGKIKDTKGEALVGASVLVKGTKNGTVTNTEGAFTLNSVPKGSTLVVSFVGYTNKEVPADGNLNITLDEGRDLEEVVVTGVFDKRTSLESSIAISKLDSKQIARLAPNSAADLLSYTPGVYVNSSVGEINNTVYSRGVNANQFSVAGGNGYYYVALMEDGLPTTNTSSGNIMADYFYRADATLSRLESVRGGSASVTGNNAPGGIFNYVSNTGQTPVRELSYKVGLEGDGRNPYNRIDGNYSGQMGNGWYYNVGGFYRASEGAQNPGYLQNVGGQLKANLVKTFSTGGFLKIYAKYLDDKNGQPQALPAQNYNNPQIVSGFSSTDSYMLPASSSVQPLWGSSQTYTFDPSNLIHNQDKTLGAELSLNLGNGWTLNNNLKGSWKNSEQDLTIMSTPTDLQNLLTYALMGMIAPGTISLTDRTTGKLMAQINADFSRGPNWTVTTNNLPNQQIMQNGVLFNFTSYSKSTLEEYIDQISFNKKVGKHSLTFGSYLAFSHLTTDPNGTGNTSLRPIESKASPLDITLTLPGGGPTEQITNPQGYAQLSGGGFSFNSYDAQQNQVAFYAADGIQATENLNIDLGLRYDYIGVTGSNNIGIPNPASAKGGIDGNPLTLYDNNYFVKGTSVPYDTKLGMFSYSAGINYKLDKNNSIYARFSDGQKAPDLQFYFNGYTTTQASPETKAQDITQFELGYKFKGDKVSGAFIPFYSRLSNIPTSSIGQDTTGLSYFTPTVFNTLTTFGLEAEGNFNLTKNFGIAANITIQSSKATVWQTWNTGQNGRADDVLVNNNGNTAENVPNVMFNISPLYTFNKGFAMLTYRYMGDREANMANTFTLPGFGQLNFSAGYDITPKISITAVINNLTNTLGVMNWMATTQFALVNAFSHDSFTPAVRAAIPNSYYQIVPIQPRAYFLTLKYKF